MKIKYLIYILSVLILAGSTSCKDEVEPRACPCHSSLQVPIYKGCEYNEDCWEAQQCGLQDMLRDVYGEIKYPALARQDSIQGRVWVEFDVDLKGVASNFRARSDTLGYGIPEAAVEGAMIVNERGFYPAEEDCTPIEYTFVMPISFKLF